MIIRDKPGVWQLMFSVRGSVLPQIAWPLLFLVAFAMGLVLVDQALLKLPDSAATPFSVLGVALSLFLGFRNNAAYDRWWEARKLWGGLVADMRALARELDLFVPDAATRHRILQLSLAFVHLHRLSLRHQSPDATTIALLDAAGAAPILVAAHPPCAALDAMNARVRTRSDFIART